MLANTEIYGIFRFALAYWPGDAVRVRYATKPGNTQYEGSTGLPERVGRKAYPALKKRYADDKGSRTARYRPGWAETGVWWHWVGVPGEGCPARHKTVS